MTSMGPPPLPKRSLDAKQLKRTDRQIVNCLTRHAQEFLGDLWNASRQNEKQMRANITQLAAFTRNDITREMTYMPPQISKLFQKRCINIVDFLLAYFTIMSRHSFCRSGRFCQSTSVTDNRIVVGEIYMDTLAFLSLDPVASTLSTISRPPTQRNWTNISKQSARTTRSTPSSHSTRTNSSQNTRSRSSHSSRSSSRSQNTQNTRSRSSRHNQTSALSQYSQYKSQYESQLTGGTVQSSYTSSLPYQRSSKSSVSDISTFAPGDSAIAQFNNDTRHMAAASVLHVPKGRSGNTHTTRASKNNTTMIKTTPAPDDSVSCIGRRHNAPSKASQQRQKTSSHNRKREPRDPSSTARSAFSSYQQTAPGSISAATLFSTYTDRSQEPVPFEQRFVQVPALTSSSVERNAGENQTPTQFGEVESEFYTAEEDEESVDGEEEEGEEETDSDESTEEEGDDDDEEDEQEQEAWDEQNSNDGSDDGSDDGNDRSNSGW